MLRISLVVYLSLVSSAWSAVSFRAGAHAEDVSPSVLPISLAGSMADIQATEIHDRLHARALVLDDGKTKLAIVVCDSCMISRDLFDAAKREIEASVGIPVEHQLMSATHSHTCPTVTGAFQSEPSEIYRKQLAQGIIAAVRKANANLEPAQVIHGAADCPDQVFCRRWHMKPGTVPPDPFGKTTDKVQMNPPVGSENLIEPAGPIDPQISVLKIQASDGRPIALLANYSLHYVGGVPARSASADYFGEFARVIAGRLAPKDEQFVAMLTNGTSGNINNINFRGGQQAMEPFGRIRLVANRVADVSIEAVQESKPLGEISLAAAQRELELGVRKASPDEVTEAKSILEKAGERPLAGLREIYARETVKLAEYPDTVKLPIQALRIGPIGIVAIPCEVFAEIGLELKAKSPIRPTFTIELANSYNGYLPTPEQHALGGYETWRARSSYLEVDASPQIVQTALELLEEVKGR